MTVLAAAAPSSGVQSKAAGLPIGVTGLAESRTVSAVASGVTLTRILRGTGRASGPIATTARGPWQINVLTIDPRSAPGRLQVTYGPNLARTETTAELARFAGALAAVNGGFFTHTRSRLYPGDPVGFAMYDGRVMSEPTKSKTEVDLILDSANSRLTFGPMRWTGTVRNVASSAQLRLKSVNHPPTVPAGCSGDQTTCQRPGQTVLFTEGFGPETPHGEGTEAVLDPLGCVVALNGWRGVTLLPGFSTIQATGRDVRRLIDVAGEGCTTRTTTVTGPDGQPVALGPGVYGMSGRFRLLEAGRIVAPAGSGGLFDRHPRTIVGQTVDGRIVLATIDGRRSSSVGATLAEAARVAQALGMRDAVNLDGGGSTAMVVRDRVVNGPSGGAQRAVADALVYVCPLCI